jgi:sucrose phosphorylase
MITSKDDSESKRECLNGLIQKLELIYPTEDCVWLAQNLLGTIAKASPPHSPNLCNDLWDQQDCFLITYGDSITQSGEKPLKTLYDFLTQKLQSYFSGVHILPFFPFTSDDGFAISDFQAVRKDLGNWEDVSNMADHFRLMADLVINHCSTSHPWFQSFCEGNSDFENHFIEVKADQDLSKVTRPRTSPLLRPVQTEMGVKYVWCTFSHDQIDLNFENPKVLEAMVQVLTGFLKAGIRVIRLDAIAYLWEGSEHKLRQFTPNSRNGQNPPYSSRCLSGKRLTANRNQCPES